MSFRHARVRLPASAHCGRQRIEGTGFAARRGYASGRRTRSPSPSRRVLEPGFGPFRTLLKLSVAQFTVSVTVAWLVVALLGAAPVWSAPVSVKVYVFFGVISPLGEFVARFEPQAGTRNKPPAMAMSKSAPNRFFRRAPLNPTNTSPGTKSNRA